MHSAFCKLKILHIFRYGDDGVVLLSTALSWPSFASPVNAAMWSRKAVKFRFSPGSYSTGRGTYLPLRTPVLHNIMYVYPAAPTV
jgi:hypothetical protein